MSVSVEKIKPCLFVLPKAQVRGWVSYQRGDVEAKPYLDNGEETSWPVKKTVSDKDEFKAARAMARRAKKKIERLGAKTSIGIFIPYEFRDKIREIEASSSREMEEFNLEAEHGRVSIHVGVFELQGENQSILNVALEEMRGNLEDLKEATKLADYKGMRKVIKKMKGFEDILPQEANDKLQVAIDSAKEQARQIRADLEKFSVPIEAVQKQMNTFTVDVARFAMIDPDDEPDEDMKKANEFAQMMYSREVDTEE